MKVILLKDTKEGKVHQVVEVKAGYGTNFLIKNELAMAYNKENLKKLKKWKKDEEILNQKLIQQAEEIKKNLGDTKLTFDLKVHNLVIHGHITRKQIFREIQKLDLGIKSHDIENVNINSLGITKVKIFLHKEVTAVIDVEVVKNE